MQINKKTGRNPRHTGLITLILFALFLSPAKTMHAQETIPVTDDGIYYDTDSLHIEDENNDKPKKSFIHEFSLWGAGGISTLMYKMDDTEKPLSFGGAFGLGYTFYFHRNWGVGVGAEMALYNANITIHSLSDNYDTKDIDGRDVNYRSAIKNYKEHQNLWNLNIPVAFYFQTDAFDIHKFYASVGFKLGVPVKAMHRSNDDASFVTSGYYPQWDQELTQQKDMGYGTFSIAERNKKLDLGLSYMATAETGIKWYLSRKLWLYTGVYAEYGFNNIVKDNSGNFISYDIYNPEGLQVNSVITSRYVNKVNPWGVGLKIKLGITLNKVPKALTEEQIQNSLLDEVIMRQDSLMGVINDVASREHITMDSIRSVMGESIDAYLKAAEQRRRNFNEMMLGVENYDINAAKLTERQKRELDNYVKIMHENRNASMTIVGYTCNLGTESFNQKLGQERADNAKDYLVMNGIAPGRITTLTGGMSNPVAPNNSEKNRKKNRRLEILLKDLNADCVLENNRYYRIQQ